MSPSYVIYMLVIFLALVQADDSSEEEEKVIQECSKKTGVNLSEIKHFKTDKVSEKMMCFMKCRYEKQGWLDEKGQLVKEILQDRYDDLRLKEEERKKIDECIDKMKPVQNCTDLGNFYKCIPVIEFSE